MFFPHFESIMTLNTNKSFNCTIAIKHCNTNIVKYGLLNGVNTKYLRKYEQILRRLDMFASVLYVTLQYELMKMISCLHIPQFDRFSISCHWFNCVNFSDWILFTSLIDVLSKYFWNTKISICPWIVHFWCSWYRWWQIHAGWNSGKETRTIRYMIDWAVTLLFRINNTFH